MAQNYSPLSGAVNPSLIDLIRQVFGDEAARDELFQVMGDTAPKLYDAAVAPVAALAGGAMDLASMGYGQDPMLLAGAPMPPTVGWEDQQMPPPQEIPAGTDWWGELLGADSTSLPFLAMSLAAPGGQKRVGRVVSKADEYLDVPAAVWNTDKKIKKTEEGAEFQKVWLGKGETPETRAFMNERRKVQKDIDAGNYSPYFNVDERHDVVSRYPERPRTTVYAKPKKEETVEKWRSTVKTDDARQRLIEAYRIGEKAGGHDAWYKMGQLEAEFIKEYGPDVGPEMFRERFSDAMAATTGGSSPKDNLVAAAYANYKRQRGEALPENSYDIPHPVGGRYISTNMKMYDKSINQGEGLVGRPKRQNFSSNFEGDADAVTVDEHMTQIMMPGKNAPPGDSYFAFEELIQETAKELGISPRELQEVAWAGRKINLKGGYDAKSMIEVVNEAIERTARLTGVSPEEVVRRGLVRAEMPIYGIGGAALLSGMMLNEDP